jgi:hypothetical protein
MVTEPSKERIAAALALAEADEFHYRNKDNKFAHDAHMAALEAYRATAPKPLRTRAEVDAEIATVMRVAFGAGSVQVRSGAVNMTSRLEELCDEPLAPDPTDSGSGRDDDAGPPLVPPSPAGAAYPEHCTCDALKLKPLELCPACPKRQRRSEHGGEADSCSCANRHLKVIGEFEAEAKALRNRISHAIWALRNNSAMAATATGCAVLRILEGKP